MKIKLFDYIQFLLLYSLLSVGYAGQGQPINQFVFFGDSLTDNGNLYRSDFGYLPKSPPYYQGRFSNGIVWSEILARNNPNIVTSNYAVGGETALLHAPSPGHLPLSLGGSIDLYLLQSAYKDRKNTLFYIWIGANDYLPEEMIPNENIPDHVNRLSTDVTQSIQENIQKLISYGGLNFVVINMPNLATIPQTIGTTRQAFLNGLAVSHNLKLSDAIKQIEINNPMVHIHLFDIDAMFQDLLFNTDVINKKFNMHIKETKKSCWEGGYTLRQASNHKGLEEKIQDELAFADDRFNQSEKIEFAKFTARSPALREALRVSELAAEGIGPCSDPDEYIFWDKLHPTAVVHQRFAEYMNDFIRDKFEIF